MKTSYVHLSLLTALWSSLMHIQLVTAYQNGKIMAFFQSKFIPQNWIRIYFDFIKMSEIVIMITT